MREIIRVLHYSIRTEQAYVGWIKRFVLFHNKQYPNEMSEKEVTAFLTWLFLKKFLQALRIKYSML